MAPSNYQTGYYPMGTGQNYQTSYALAPVSAVAMGGVGALVGAVSATAAGLQQVRDQQASGQAVALSVAKEAAGTGLAFAAGGAVARAMGLRGFAGLLGAFTVATGVKYFWNQAMDRPAPVVEEPAQAPAKPKKAAKK